MDCTAHLGFEKETAHNCVHYLIKGFEKTLFSIFPVYPPTCADPNQMTNYLTTSSELWGKGWGLQQRETRSLGKETNQWLLTLHDKELAAPAQISWFCWWWYFLFMFLSLSCRNSYWSSQAFSIFFLFSGRDPDEPQLISTAWIPCAVNTFIYFSLDF